MVPAILYEKIRLPDFKEKRKNFEIFRKVLDILDKCVIIYLVPRV